MPKKGKPAAHKIPLTRPKPIIEKVVPKSRTRGQRPFPAAPFEEAMSLALDLYRVGSGQPVRRLTLFDDIKKAPESGNSRMLITNANRYGLISGGYSSEYLELTSDGIKAVDETTPDREQARIRAKLAIERIEAFNQLYERFKGTKLPARAVLLDAMKEISVPSTYIEEGVDTFIVNLRFVGLLQTLSGAERIVTFDHLLDTIPVTARPMVTSSTIAAGYVERGRTSRSELITKEHVFTLLLSAKMDLLNVSIQTCF